MLNGRVVQNNLLSTLIRFRQYPVVISADIEKIYKQILIAPEQRLFQRIVWREHSSLPLETFELNTYDIATTLYLSHTKQVDIEARHGFSTASRVIKSDFYVDGLLTDAEIPTEARRNVEKILLKVEVILRKWASNETTTLQENSEATAPIAPDANLTVELLWNLAFDILKFHANTPNMRRVTKRTILSGEDI